MVSGIQVLLIIYGNALENIMTIKYFPPKEEAILS